MKKPLSIRQWRVCRLCHLCYVFVIFWNGNGTIYDLYCNNNFLATLSTTTYIDSNLIEGATYCYKVKATNDNGCESVFSDEICETYGDVSIAETRHAASLRVYPNPTTGELIISLPNPSEGRGAYEDSKGACPLVNPNVEIYNIVGQRVLQFPCRDAINSVFTINVSHLTNGVYFLKIGNKTVKFVKE